MGEFFTIHIANLPYFYFWSNWPNDLEYDIVSHDALRSEKIFTKFEVVTLTLTFDLELL